MSDFDSRLPIRTEADGDASVGVLDTTNTRIDPATSGKQDTGNASLANIESDINLIQPDVATIKTQQTDGTQKSQVVDGAGDVLGVNADGSINVVVQNEDTLSSTEKHQYNTSAAVAPATPTNVVNYTVTAGKTFKLKKFYASGSGKIKVELKTGTAGSEASRAVGFNSTSEPNIDITLPSPIEVIAGDKILVVVTNRDNQAQDLYAFINGNEV